MNLYKKLQERVAEGRPIRIGMIGAGKFGTMFLAQAVRIPAIHIFGIVDIVPDNAKSNMKLVGWADEAYDATDLDDAVATGKTFVGDDWQALIDHEAIEIVVECTGNPMAAVTHCLGAFAHKKNVVNVTVESRCLLWSRVGKKGRRGRRHLQHGLWRSTGACQRFG